MLVTTKDAGQLWCPLVRQPSKDNDPHGSRDVEHKCISTRCAMWRWDPDFPRQKFHQATGEAATFDQEHPEPARPPQVPASWTWSPYESEGYAGWLEPQDEANRRRVGYCGMAGMPVEMAKIVAEAGR